MEWRISAYVAILLISAAISAAVMLFAWQRRLAHGGAALARLMLAVTVFALTAALEAAAVEQATKITLSKLQYLGSMTAPVLFLLFALEYARADRWRRRRVIAALFAPAILAIGLAWTNEAHHLIWQDFHFSPLAPNLLIYEHGSWFWINLVYLYVIVALGTIVLIRSSLNLAHVYRRQAVALLVAVLCAWAGSILYVFDLSPVPGVDWTSISFVVTGAVLAWGVSQYRLFDLAPVARSAVFEELVDSVIVLDLQNRVIDLNAAALRLLGLSHRPIGDLAEQVFVGQSEVVERLRHAEPERFEIVMGDPPRHLDVHLSQLRDRRGRPTGRLISFRDVTERQLVQEALRDLKDFNESIVQNVAEGIVIQDLRGDMIFANPAACTILKYRMDELIGRHWTVVIPEDQWPLIAVIDQRRARGESNQYEVTLLRSDGERVPVLVSGSPRFDPATGDFVGTIAVFTDIIERKQAEERLRQSEMWLRQVIDLVPNLIFAKDAAGRYILANEAAARMYGLTVEQVLGQTDLDLAPTREEAVRFRQSDMEVIRSGQQLFIADDRLTDVTGQRHYLQTTKIPFKLSGSGQAALLGVAVDVSERWQAEERLRQNEKWLRQVIDLIPNFIFAKDSAGRFVLVNQAVADIYGTTVEDLIGRLDADFARSEAEARRFHEDDLAVIRNGRPLIVPEEKITDARGAVHYLQTTKIPFTLSGSGEGALLGVASDITERKRAEEALSTSEALYHTLVETLPVSIFRKDLEGRIIFANTRYCQGQNQPLENILGKTDFDLHPPELAEKYREDDRQVILAGRTFETVEVHQTKGGESTFVQTIKTPIYGPDGRPSGVQGMFWDITERKRAEEALAQRAREMAALYETVVEINAQVDLDTLLHAIVRRAADLLGAPMGGLYLLRPDGETLELVVGHNLPAAYLGTRLKLGEGLSGVIAQTGQLGMVEDYQTWAGRAAVYGNTPFKRVLGVPLKSGSRLIGVINISDDQFVGRFTDDQVRLALLLADQAALAIEQVRLYTTIQAHAVELEERVAARTTELTTAYEQLQELDRLKDEFVSRISHELRTPITNIQLYLNLLRMGKPEKRDEYILTLRAETTRLNKMIEDLLALSRLDMGQVELKIVPTDLNHLVAGLQPDWQRVAHERGLSFTLNLEPRLPPARADAALLSQALTHLVANAIHYTPAGGAVLCLTEVRAVDDEDWLTITVRDTGPGIAPDELPRLFGRFYRGRAARNYKVPGTGLGLATSKGILDKLGGRITVRSEAGAGAAFTLWLRPA